MLKADSADEFKTLFDMAISLWKRRDSLIPECDVTADWEDLLEDIESRYRDHVAALAPLTPRYFAKLEPSLRSRGPACQVAVHLMMMSADSRMLERIGRLAGDQASRRHVDIADMTRFCEGAVFDSVVAALTSLHHPWLLDALAWPIAGRGARQFEPALASGLIAADGKPSAHVIRALARLGAVRFGPQLETLLAETSRTDEFYTATTLARALYWLKSPAGRQFYRNEIQREDMHQHDMTFWYAFFSTPSDVDFFAERIARTQFGAWKEQLLRASGIMGSPRAVPILINHLQPDDHDIRLAANDALERMLGVLAEADPEDGSDGLQHWWRDWWDEHAGEYDTALRYRDGELFSLSAELSGLSHPIAEERKHHHEHLAVYTGVYLPFDHQTYLAWQKQAAAKWQQWIDANAGQFPAGGWW